MSRTYVGIPTVEAKVLRAHITQGQDYDRTRWEETPDSFYDRDLQQWYGLQPRLGAVPETMDTFEFQVWLEQAPVDELESFANRPLS